MIRRVFVLALVAAASSAASQTLPSVHDTIIVTATTDAVPVTEVSAASTVIDGLELSQTGIASIADALRWVPGAVVVRSGGEGNVTSLFVRGANSNQTLVLFDGIRLNSPFFGGYDWSLPLAAGIGRIEVVRGPYSALYGGDAIGGVVNLVPVRAERDRVRVVVEDGGDAWRRADAEAALTGQGWDLVAAGSRRSGDGPLDNDEFSTSTATAHLGLTLGRASHLGILVRSTDADTQIPFSGADRTPRRSTSGRETLLAVPLHIGFSPTSRLDVTASRVRRSLTFRDPDDPWGYVRSDTDADSNTLSVAFHAAASTHQFVAGGEVRDDRVTDGSNFGTNLEDRRITTRAAFAQDVWTISPRTELLTGVRWDDASPWGREVSPRATLTWHGSSSRWWTAYGHAFRAPGLGELYYPFSGNPDLKPERADSWEVGVSSPGPSGLTVVQLVAFSNRVDNLIDFDYATFAYTNIAGAKQDGAELSWIALAARDSRLRVALSFLNARDDRGQDLLRRPRWSGSVSIGGPLAASLHGEAALVFVGSHTDVDPVSYSRVAQPGFVTASLTTRLSLGSGLAVRARLENAANRRYEEVRGYPAPGRRLMLGFEAEF